MTYYLVKETSTPTNDNPLPGVEGVTLVTYYGRGCKSTDTINSPYGAWFMQNYGYTRKSDAKRNFVYRQNPDESKYWKNVVEIVEI